MSTIVKVENVSREFRKYYQRTFKEFLTEYTGKTAVGSTGYLFKVGLVPNSKETEEKVREVATKLVAMKN
jgi:hypothetical protein